MMLLALALAAAEGVAVPRFTSPFPFQRRDPDSEDRKGIDCLMASRSDDGLDDGLMNDVLFDCRHGVWTKVLRRDGVQVWKRDSDTADETAAFSVKARCVCPVPARVLTGLLTTRDYNVVKTYNPTVDNGHDLEHYPARGERVTYILTKPIWPLRARDFVCNVRHLRRPKVDLIVNSPATHRKSPPRVGKVRGRLAGVHLIESTDATSCTYTMVHQVTPPAAAATPVAPLPPPPPTRRDPTRRDPTRRDPPPSHLAPPDPAD